MNSKTILNQYGCNLVQDLELICNCGHEKCHQINDDCWDLRAKSQLLHLPTCKSIVRMETRSDVFMQWKESCLESSKGTTEMPLFVALC